MVVTVHGELLLYLPILQQLPVPVEYLQYLIDPLYPDLTSEPDLLEVLSIYYNHQVVLFIYSNPEGFLLSGSTLTASANNSRSVIPYF